MTSHDTLRDSAVPLLIGPPIILSKYPALLQVWEGQKSSDMLENVASFAIAFK